MSFDLRETSILNGTSHHFWCKIETVSKAKYTVLISQVVVASYAIFFYIVVLTLSAFGAFLGKFRRLLSMQVSSILFLVGALAITINILGNADNEAMEAKLYYRIPCSALVGIVYMVTGACVFFERPHRCTEDCNLLREGNASSTIQQCRRRQNYKFLGLQQPSMGFIVTIITFPLLLIELFLVLGTETKTKNETKQYKMIKKLLLSDKTLLLCQKLVQVVTYIALRNITVSRNYRINARFYFKILAFYNLEAWLDSVVNTDSDLKLSTALETYGKAFESIETVYKALLIDYRLLCAVLFLEHALEVDDDGNGGEQIETTRARYIMTSSDQMKRNLGYLIGLLCIIARVLTAVNYIDTLRIGSWVHVLAILINVLVAVCGVVFLRKNDLKVQRTADKEWKGVKIIMCCMGAVGLTCWIIKGTLVALLVRIMATESKKVHFEWAATKILTRGVGSGFLMVIYAKMNVKVIANNNQHVKINHLLVPTLMLSILAEAIGCAIDQHQESADKKLLCVINDPSLRILLAMGPPMHLGFKIHVILHFLVTHQMMLRVSRTNKSLADETTASDQTERLLPDITEAMTE